MKVDPIRQKVVAGHRISRRLLSSAESVCPKLIEKERVAHG